MAFRLIDTEILQNEAAILKTKLPANYIASGILYKENGFADAITDICRPISTSQRVIEKDNNTLRFYNFTTDLQSNQIPTNAETIDLSKSPALEYIDDYMFEDRDTVKNIILPETTKYIGIGTFLNCNNLQSININDIINLGSDAFNGCNNLYIEAFPPSLEHIGHSSLCGVKYNVRQIEIPEGIDELYAYCMANSNINKIWIRNTCSRVFSLAFSGNPDDLEIYCEAPSQPTDWDYDWNKKQLDEDERYTVHWNVTERPW